MTSTATLTPLVGVDLVREQIRVASGMDLSFTQDELEINGHAIEVRINAEKIPNFSPCPGRITQFHAPGGLGVRMDSAIYDGYRIPPYYDSLIGKLIVHGRDRPEALSRLKLSKGETVFLTETPEGYTLTPYDPALEEEIEAGRAFMREYRDTFHQLAK